MYFVDHNPPHFHAFYGDDEAVFLIDTLELTSGKLQSRVVGLVVEWAAIHKHELVKTGNYLKKKNLTK